MNISTEPQRIPAAQVPALHTIAARESYELLSTVFAGTDDLVFAKDRDGRYLNLNAAVAAYFGRPIDEIIGRTDWDLIPPDRARFIAATDRLVLSTGENTSYEVKAPRGEGVMWIYTTKAPVRDDQGRIVGVVGIGHDITARKQAEAAQQLSETRLAAAQAIAHLGGWEWNLRTNDVVWSAECYRIFGIEPQTFVSTYASVVHLFHPGDAERFRSVLAAAVRGRVAFKDDFRIIRPSGEERCIQVEGVVTQHADGAPLIISGTVHDITEGKLADLALRRSEATLARAQRIARIASWRWDLRTGMETWSNEIYEILGLSPVPPMSFRYFLEFVHPDDRAAVRMAFNSTMAGTAPHSLDFRVKNTGGRVCFIHSVGETMHAPDGAAVAVVGTLQDITERKMIEAELAASRDELRDLTHHLQHVQEDERRRIAREIHDEFGAVFTAANLSLYRVASMLQDASPQARDLLASTKEMIADAGKSLDDIVNGLHPQMLSHLGLAATMEWYIAEFEKRTGITCVRSIPEPTASLNEQVSLALFRCLQESLTNVAKHSGAGRVRIIFTLSTNQISLTVSDDGRGFSVESLGTPDAFGIRGLQARINQLGGTLRLHPTPTGTRLAVTLPTSS